MTNDAKFPHLYSGFTSSRAVWIAVGVLLPVVPWSAYVFGAATLVVWTASVLSAVAAELVASAFSRKISLGDGSAVLTGLLIACAMPPAIHPLIPASIAVFSILVVKVLFGGFGSNWANPAMAGVAFAHLTWPEAMRSFTLPRIFTGLDGISASSPLAFSKSIADGSPGEILGKIHGAGYPVSKLDVGLTGWLNDTLFGHMSISMPAGYVDLFLGFRTGTLGDTAIWIVLLGSLLLFALRVIRIEAPFAMIGAFLACSFLATLTQGADSLRGSILFNLLSSGTILVAIFCTSDPVTTPAGGTGLALFGLLVGCLSFAFMRWGVGVEGAAFAILLVNAATPSIDAGMMRLRALRRKRLDL